MVQDTKKKLNTQLCRTKSKWMAGKNQTKPTTTTSAALSLTVTSLGTLCLTETSPEAWPHPPVQVQLMGQHPPVMTSGLWGVQAAAELLPDGGRDAESTRACHGGDGASRVQQRQIDASGFL